MRVVVHMMCLVVTLILSASTAIAEQRYAIVIGSNPGWAQDRPLRYAEHDAERVRDVLIALGNFAPDRVELLRDPDTADVRTTLRRLADTTKSSSEPTLVFIYYSGHADNERLHLRGEPLTHRELHATLRSLPATIKLAVIDACKSGAVTRKGGSPTSEFDINVENPKLSGTVILTSSGADELSQESRALAGSVFTHHLVSALRGAGDENNDRAVSISEAYHYAYTRTRADTATTGIPQRPAFRYELTGQGELLLTHLQSQKSARATVPKGGQSKYVILDSHEWRLIAEARPERDRDVVLALAPGNYRVKRVLPDRLEVSTLVLGIGDRADLDRMTYQSAPLSAGIVKGDPTDLSPSERADWERAQAYNLLAAGQAQAAITKFDQLLRYDSGDTLAWRGRGRALMRMAEAYQAVNDQPNERRSLNEALRADPSLAHDPTFKLWYQRIAELDARAKQTFQADLDHKAAIKSNPRRTKRVGVGFDLIAGRGAGAITVSAVVSRIVFPRIAFDLAGPGADISFVIAPFPSRWSPYLGAGGHLSFSKLGLGDPDMCTSTVTTGDGMTSSSFCYDEIWGKHVRVEGGAQYIHSSGFSTELGLAMIVFTTDPRINPQVQEKKSATQVMPVLHFGWYW